MKYIQNGVQLNGKTLLLNQHNQPLFPDTKIFKINSVSCDGGRKIKGIYEVEYEVGNRRRKVYMDKYGKVYKEGTL